MRLNACSVTHGWGYPPVGGEVVARQMPVKWKIISAVTTGTRYFGGAARRTVQVIATAAIAPNNSRNESQCAGVPIIASRDAAEPSAHACQRSGRMDTAAPTVTDPTSTSKSRT